MPIVASCVLLLLAILAYRKHLGKGGSVELLAMRLVVLLLLALALAGSVVRVGWDERPRRVVVLVDCSASMGVGGTDTTATQLAESFPLPPGVRREVWWFAGSAGRGLRPEPGRTRIATAVRSAARTRPGAIVLVSDGQDNGEDDPVEAAADAVVPVHTVGVGLSGTRNVRINRLELPSVVFVGDTFSVAVRVFGRAEPSAAVTLRLGSQSRQIVVGPEQAEQDVEFRVSLAAPGRNRLDVSADSLSGEADYTDNRQVGFVDVRPARTRVAYLTDQPGPNTRFVLDVLRRLPRVELAAVWTGVEDWPADGAARADIFVVDAPSASADAWLAGPGARVRDGAAMMVLAGPGMGVGAELGRLLPAESIGRLDAQAVTPIIAEEGRYLSWLSDGLGGEALPPFRASFGLRRRSESVLLLSALEDGRPLVLSGKAGRGCVMFVAGFPLWRWGFGPDVNVGGTTMLEAFMVGAFHYLGERDTTRFRLEADKPGYLQGEPVKLSLLARRPDGSAWDGLRAGVAVDSAPVSVPMAEVEPGRYEAIVQSWPGKWQARSEVRDEDSFLGVAWTSFEIAEQSVELARTGLNAPLLRSLAAVSHGRYFGADSMPRDASWMKLAVQRRALSLDSRRAVWVYVVAALLAALELVLRRRKGML